MSEKRKANPYQKKYSRRELFQSLIGRGQRSDTASTGSKGRDEGGRLLARGDHAGAAERFAAYLEQFPDHVPTRCKLVVSLYNGGRLQEARSELESMLEQGAAPSFARLYLGLVLARQGRAGEALAVWGRYFNIDQPLIQRAINLLKGRQEIGETPSAQELVDEVESAISAQQKADRR